MHTSCYNLGVNLIRRKQKYDTPKSIVDNVEITSDTGQRIIDSIDRLGLNPEFCYIVSSAAYVLYGLEPPTRSFSDDMRYLDFSIPTSDLNRIIPRPSDVDLALMHGAAIDLVTAGHTPSGVPVKSPDGIRMRDRFVIKSEAADGLAGALPVDMISIYRQNAGTVKDHDNAFATNRAAYSVPILGTDYRVITPERIARELRGSPKLSKGYYDKLMIEEYLKELRKSA